MRFSFDMNQSKWEKTSYLVLERINSEEHVLQEQSPEMFSKKRCSEKFRKIHMPQPATLLKKRLAQVFSFEFCEISKNSFFTENLGATASVSQPFAFIRTKVLSKFHFCSLLYQ